LPRPANGHGGTGRVLGSAGHHDRRGAGADGPAETVHCGPLVVDGHRYSLEPERRDEIDEVRPARVLDGDPVAGAQMRAEQALDRVERAGVTVTGAVGTLSAASWSGQLDERAGPGPGSDGAPRPANWRNGPETAEDRRRITEDGCHAGRVAMPRRASGGRARTRVPLRPAVSTTPRWRRLRYAEATVAGASPSSAASARTGGSTSPGRSAPPRTPASTLPDIWAAVLPAI
jgi:hypothetical protein